MADEKSIETDLDSAKTNAGNIAEYFKEGDEIDEYCYTKLQTAFSILVDATDRYKERKYDCVIFMATDALDSANDCKKERDDLTNLKSLIQKIIQQIKAEIQSNIIFDMAETSCVQSDLESASSSALQLTEEMGMEEDAYCQDKFSNTWYKVGEAVQKYKEKQFDCVISLASDALDSASVCRNESDSVKSLKSITEKIIQQVQKLLQIVN